MTGDLPSKMYLAEIDKLQVFSFGGHLQLRQWHAVLLGMAAFVSHYEDVNFK